MISRYEVLLWNAVAGRHETIERSEETEMKLRARLSVELANGIEIRGVTRLYSFINPTKDWLSTQEASEYTGWHRSTLLRFVDAGELQRSHDSAGEPRYRKAALDALLEGKSKKAKAA